MNKEFERCGTFLAEMMEKYDLEVLCDIAVEFQFDPETWRHDAEGNNNMDKTMSNHLICTKCKLSDFLFFLINNTLK